MGILSISPEIVEAFQKKGKGIVEKIIVFLRVIEVTYDESFTEVYIGEHFDEVNNVTHYGNHYTCLVFDVKEKVVTYCDSRGKRDPSDILKFLGNLEKEFFDAQFNFALKCAHAPDASSSHLNPHKCNENCSKFFPLQTCSNICGVAIIVVAVIAAKDISKFRDFALNKQDFPLKYLKDVSSFSDFLRLIILKWVCTGVYDPKDLLPEYSSIDVKSFLSTTLKKKRHDDEQFKNIKRQRIDNTTIVEYKENTSKDLERQTIDNTSIICKESAGKDLRQKIDNTSVESKENTCQDLERQKIKTTSVECKENACKSLERQKINNTTSVECKENSYNDTSIFKHHLLNAHLTRSLCVKTKNGYSIPTMCNVKSSENCKESKCSFEQHIKECTGGESQQDKDNNLHQITEPVMSSLRLKTFWKIE